jgi:hypothetical protein
VDKGTLSRANRLHQENSMLAPIKQFLAWLSDSRPTADATQPTLPAFRGTAPQSAVPEPMWHGDHWQNLLSSPLMGARHYVTEDWSLPQAAEA